MSGPEVREASEILEPKLAAAKDAVFQHKQFFEKLQQIHSQPKEQFSAEQQRLLYLLFTRFRLSGALLDDAAKKQLREVTQRLATLYTASQHKLLKEEDSYLHFTGSFLLYLLYNRNRLRSVARLSVCSFF